MDIFKIIDILSLIKKIWNFLKEYLFPPEDKLKQELIRKVTKNIKGLSEKDIGLQIMAIQELEQIASDKKTSKSLQEIICISLCQYLSVNPKSSYAFDVLFKKGSVFAPMQKEIKNTIFVELKLNGLHKIENAIFENCEFVECCFHNICFQKCYFVGGKITGSVFKDEIKWDRCHFRNVQMKNLYFRHNSFNSVTIQGELFMSSTILRSEFNNINILQNEMNDVIFEICKFHMEGFFLCQMNNVRFKFKDSENDALENMRDNIVNIGYNPSVERSSMTIAVI